MDPTRRKNTLVSILLLLSFTIGYLSPLFMYSPPIKTSQIIIPNISSPASIDHIEKDLDGIQPIGNATIENIVHLGRGVMETTQVGIDPTTISMSYIDWEFLGVQNVATAELNSTDYIRGNIKIRMNESVEFNYWSNDTATLLNYKSELARGKIIDMYINQTAIANISEVTLSSAGGYNYNYSSYHDTDPIGTLVVDYIYDYNVTMVNWRLLQKTHPYSPVETPYITENRTEIVSYYNYTWQMGDFSVDCIVDFIINIPDIEYLRNIDWKKTYSLTNTTSFTGYTQLTNSTFRLSNLQIDKKPIIIDFETNHTIEIVNKFSDYWLRDYLVEGRSQRARDFDISVVEGPPSIFVSNFRLNLTDVFFEEFVSVTSLFNRSLIFKDTYRDYARLFNGSTLEFLGDNHFLRNDYYLLVGEVDTITFTYEARSILEFKVVDKINNPLKNAEVVISFGNATYGTYISEEKSVPYAAKLTGANGIISYHNVPRGKYLVDVYYKGQLVADDIPVFTESLNQLVITSVPHFPTWIILFAGFSTVIGLVGYIIFKKARS